ncbi:hypothetical protein ACJX0J_011975, partial [Zea mays]
FYKTFIINIFVWSHSLFFLGGGGGEGIGAKLQAVFFLSVFISTSISFLPVKKHYIVFSLFFFIYHDLNNNYFKTKFKYYKMSILERMESTGAKIDIKLSENILTIL